MLPARLPTVAPAPFTQLAPVSDQLPGREDSVMLIGWPSVATTNGSGVPPLAVLPSTWVGVWPTVVVTLPLVCTVLSSVKENGPPAPPRVVLYSVRLACLLLLKVQVMLSPASRLIVAVRVARLVVLALPPLTSPLQLNPDSDQPATAPSVTV